MALEMDQVRWVSHLARLSLSDSDLATVAKKLGAILEFIDQLKQVNTDGIEPLAHPLSVSNVFREDVPTPPLSTDDALANAPKRIGDYFGVPAILE